LVERLHTRRRFLVVGAGAALGAAVLRTRWLEKAASAATVSNAGEIHAGELRLFAGDFVPEGWFACNGQDVPVAGHEELAKAIGKSFGGDGHTRVGLPDLHGRGLVGSGHAPDGPAEHVGDEQRALAVRHTDNDPSTLGLTYLISPHRRSNRALRGEIRAFAFDFPPQGWEVCDGRELLIQHHVAMFSVIHDRFGGDGRTTFALPDLRSATPVGQGDGPGPPTPLGTRRFNLAAGGASRRPRLHVNYCIAFDGEYPNRGG
jgi:microcystin-dependent protein